MSEKPDPDIAFWFDEEGYCIVKYREGLHHADFCMALVDLLAKAIESSKSTEVSELKKN